MFIETLEFTIPVDLCDLFSSLKRGPKSNMEFPASVNSYGTTQDANIQVALRANKLTFKVDGVSSNSSMISKSECKTLKLSVFDVDTAIGAEEEYNSYPSDIVTQNMQYSNQVKRTREYSAPVSPPPPAKSSRNSFSDTPSRNIPQYSSTPRQSNQNQSKSNDTPVNIKQEPEDPDLIEIEPDPEPEDIVPKKETPYMQIDYSSDVPHTQTSQAALERLSHPHPHSSHSQSPASSSSSFHQNVPHVQDYSEPGPSQMHHGDQSADDFLVFQDDDDGGEDNEADYSNDDGGSQKPGRKSLPGASGSPSLLSTVNHSEEAKLLQPSQNQFPVGVKFSVSQIDGQTRFKCNFCKFSSRHMDIITGHVLNLHTDEKHMGSDTNPSSMRTQNVGPDGVVRRPPWSLQHSGQPFPSSQNDFTADIPYQSLWMDSEGKYEIKVLPDGRSKFWCRVCDYYSDRRYNMDRHLAGSLHSSKVARVSAFSSIQF